MKQKFLVMTLGFWGRGNTLREAAQNCLRSGASRKQSAAVKLYLHPEEDPDPELLNALQIAYTAGSQVIDIGSPFKLGQLLTLKD